MRHIFASTVVEAVAAATACLIRSVVDTRPRERLRRGGQPPLQRIGWSPLPKYSITPILSAHVIFQPLRNKQRHQIRQIYACHDSSRSTRSLDLIIVLEEVK
jgi:hypothetical protein